MGPAAVVAVIVTFNPGDNLATLTGELVGQGCQVLVFDNASTAGTGVLAACSELGANVIRHHANVGVGAALALTLEVLPEAPWLLTFDQDSRVPPEFVVRMLSSPAAASQTVAVVGPRVIDAESRAPQQGQARKEWYPVARVITSGALCRVDAVRSVGGFRSDLFIDYVDFDLCSRLRRAGWSLAIEPSVVLEHSIGRLTHHALPLGIVLRTSNHSPDRQYYKYRNFVLLTLDGTFAQDWRWVLRSAAGLITTPVKILVLESDRRRKLGAIAAGLWDGIRRRGGVRPGRDLARRAGAGSLLLPDIHRRRK